MTDRFTNGYALLIAVNENTVPRWALPVVTKDVEALAAVLIHPERCAYPQENVKIVMGKNATRQGIVDGLAWLAERLSADTSGNTTAVIYYSGHGWRDTNSSSPTYFLIPYDIRESAARLTALRAAEFADAIDGLTPRRLLVILDCCHAGGMDVKDVDVAGAEAKGAPSAPAGYVGSAVPPVLFMGGEKAVIVYPASSVFELARGAGRAVLSSSQGEQSSYIRRDGAMSIFTYHLVEALTGHARPAVGASEVLVSDVMSYVTRRVPQSALADSGREQTPDFQISGNFPVALILGGKGLATGSAAPDPLAPLALQQPPAGIHMEIVHGDKVDGDKISVGNITGTGIAIGSGAHVEIRQGLTGADPDHKGG